MHEMAVLDKTKARLPSQISGCPPRRQSSQHWPYRSVMLTEVANLNLGQVCMFTGRRQHQPKNKRITVRTEIKYIETSRRSSYIRPHLCKRHQPHSDAVEITPKKLASVVSVPLRGVIMAPNRHIYTIREHYLYASCSKTEVYVD